MAKTQNIKPFDEQNTANAGGTKVARNPKSKSGLYYGTDNLIKKIINGKEVWVEKSVHPTRT